MIGEATRTHIVQRTAQEVFKKDHIERTLNSAEAVAQGCSLTAAMILPHFHVQNFLIEECNQEPVDVSWSVSGNNNKTKTLFPLKNNFPSIKSMTFDNRTEPINVAISYNKKNNILKGLPTDFSRYRIEIPKPDHLKFALKLRIKLDQNCIPGLDTAELIEEYKEEKKIPIKVAASKKAKAPEAPKKEAKDGEDKKDAEMKPAEEPKAPEQTFETKLVDKTRTTNIPFKWEKQGLSVSAVDDHLKYEQQMFSQDRKILDVKESRNHLETYVYDMRDKCGDYGDRKEMIKEEDRVHFLETLNTTESWLYDTKGSQEEYETRLMALQTVGEPVNARFRFFDALVYKQSQFEEVLRASYDNGVSIPEDSHITVEEKDALLKLVEETKNWLVEQTENLKQAKKFEDAPFTLELLDSKKQLVVDLTNKTLNKPKPAPKKEEEKVEDKKTDEKTDENTDEKKTDEKETEGDKDAEMKPEESESKAEDEKKEADQPDAEMKDASEPSKN